MAALMSDAEVIQRVLDHVTNRTTDLGDDIWREPVKNDRSQERFELEMELFKRLPMVYCPSGALPENGILCRPDLGWHASIGGAWCRRASANLSQ